MSKKIGIAGAGSFGIAVANVVARAAARDYVISLWDINVKRIAELQRTRRSDLLAGAKLDDRLIPTSEFTDLADAEVIFIVTPSFAIREMAARLAEVKARGTLVSCTKGIEYGTRLRMSEILAQHLPENVIAVLSGPSHAEEMAAGIPTAVVLGCDNEEALAIVKGMLWQPHFHVSTCTDCIGIEVGGALKNIYAIAAGVVDGLGFGIDTKAALITRSLVELAGLGESMGGRRETFYGLSGLGDLMATCFSPRSRNRFVGEQLAHGRKKEEILASMAMVSEGVSVTLNIYEYANKHGIPTPILKAVYDLLHGKGDVQAFIPLLF